MQKFSDNMDAIAANLILRNEQDENLKHLIFLSAVRGEGKTFIIEHLAGALAKTHKNILLLDLNYQNPDLSEKFRINNPFSLLQKDVDKISYQDTEYENVKISGIEKGGVVLSMFSSANYVDSFLDRIGNGFDFVLIDLPSAQESILGYLLAARLKKALIILKANKTKRRSLDQMFEELTRLSVNVQGFIFNYQRIFIPKLFQRFY